jgi:FtsZ-binding cell division protein ZapB
MHADPTRSDRELARLAKVSHHTVADVREQEEARWQIAHVDTRTDSKGRRQPAKKLRSARREPPEEVRKLRIIDQEDGPPTPHYEPKEVTPLVPHVGQTPTKIEPTRPKQDGLAALDAKWVADLHADRDALVNLEAALAELEAENRRLEATITDHEATARGYQKTIDDLKHDIDQLKGQNLDFEQQINELEQENADLKAASLVYEQTITDLRRRIEGSRQDAVQVAPEPKPEVLAGEKISNGSKRRGRPPAPMPSADIWPASARRAKAAQLCENWRRNSGSRSLRSAKCSTKSPSRRRTDPVITQIGAEIRQMKRRGRPLGSKNKPKQAAML